MAIRRANRFSGNQDEEDATTDTGSRLAPRAWINTDSEAIGKDDGMLFVKGIIGCLFQVGLFTAALLGVAGTWDWPRAVQFLAGYGALNIGMMAIMVIYAPQSLEARLRPPFSKEQPLADQFATAAIGLSFSGWLWFIPIDVFRLQIFAKPGILVSGAGVGVLLIG